MEVGQEVEQRRVVKFTGLLKLTAKASENRWLVQMIHFTFGAQNFGLIFRGRTISLLVSGKVFWYILETLLSMLREKLRNQGARKSPPKCEMWRAFPLSIVGSSVHLYLLLKFGWTEATLHFSWPFAESRDWLHQLGYRHLRCANVWDISGMYSKSSLLQWSFYCWSSWVGLV